MVKKSVFAALVAIILLLSCSLSFATEGDRQNVDLGNEITGSLDKAGDSVDNLTDDVFSDNIVDTNRDTDTRTDTSTSRVDNNTARNTTVGAYNTIRTTAEGTETGMSTMSTTTWMWIILAVAAIIIIAAIWYYATQSNE